MSAYRNEQRAFLGKGWKFPLQVTPGGRIATSAREQRIEESIYLILGTAKGERVMQPDFGCGIHDLVFKPNSSATRTAIVASVRDALLRFEPRIDVQNVETEQTPDQPEYILIRVNYRIRANNTLTNLVYPFFIQEGF